MKTQLKLQAICVVVLSGFLLGACTPEKARALKTAAVQFKVEALAAIHALEEMMKKETAPPPRSEAEATEEFVKNILSIPLSDPLSVEIIDLAGDPFTVAPGPEERQRQDFIANLHQQYFAFAAIFDDLESGSFLARDAVRASAKYAKDLTVQMAAFAESIGENPPQLLQHRSKLIGEFDVVRKDNNLSADEKRRRLVELKEQWEAVKAAEQELQRSTVEQCVKAAVIGMEVRRLIDTYENVSLDDLNAIIARVLDVAGGLTGKDLGTLKTKSREVFAKIKRDEIWSDVADSVLNKVTTAIAR